MQLQPGERAPSFYFVDYQGNSISLENFADKNILLSFFRDAACPFCNLYFHKLSSMKATFEKYNIQPIAFFSSTSEEIKEYAGGQNSWIPIVPDPSFSMYKQYKLESSLMAKLKSLLRFKTLIQIMTKGFFNLRSLSRANTIPADFLIDIKRTIVLSHYGNHFDDHLAFDEIMKALNVK